MKLYAHPVSTTSRPIMMFCDEQGVDVELVVIDLLSGAHKQPEYLAINPNGMVPMLEDDGFMLTEASAILKYLADKVGSPTYPTEPHARARVNEVMDWFNTNLYREIGYHLVYPQAFPTHARATDEMTQSVVDWGLARTPDILATLNSGWVTFADGGPYLLGNDITIADYLGADLLGCADLIRLNWDRYPNVALWFQTMKERPAWGRVHEVFDSFTASMAAKEVTTIT